MPEPSPSPSPPPSSHRSLWTRLLPNLPHPHSSTVLASLVPLLAPSIATMGMGATSTSGSSSSSDLSSLQPPTSSSSSTPPTPDTGGGTGSGTGTATITTVPSSTDVSPSSQEPRLGTRSPSRLSVPTSLSSSGNVDCCDCRMRQLCDTANGPGHTLVYGSTLKACAICLDEYRSGDRLRVLDPCGHTFHTACIDQWFDNELFHRYKPIPMSSLSVMNVNNPAYYLPCPVCKTAILIHSLPPKSVHSEKRSDDNNENNNTTVNHVQDDADDDDVNNSRQRQQQQDDEQQQRQPWAHVQLIDLSVHQSWVEWFSEVWKVAELGNTSTPRRRV